MGLHSDSMRHKPDSKTLQDLVAWLPRDQITRLAGTEWKFSALCRFLFQPASDSTWEISTLHDFQSGDFSLILCTTVSCLSWEG